MASNSFYEQLIKNIVNYFNIIQNHKNFDSFIEQENTINYELEFIYINNLNVNKFKTIIQYLKSEDQSNLEMLKELNVSSFNNYESLSNIRITINDSDIQSFCNNEILYISNDIKPKTFQKKIDVTDKIKKLVLNDFKLNLKLEDTITEEDNDIARFIEYYEIEKTKTYRLKNRITFKYDYYKIDMTIIKQIDNYDIKSKLFSDPYYECELEIFTKKIFENNDFYNKETKIFNYDSSNFKKIIKDICTKLTIINNLISDNLYSLDINTKKIIKKQYEELTKSKKILGPKPISLTYKDLNHIFSDDTNEIYDYSFTDKADGERYNLFINKEGNLYLLNSSNHILNLNRKITNSTYFNTIIDGELITKNYTDNLDIFNDNLTLTDIVSVKSKKYIYDFNAFDIYILNNTNYYEEDLFTRVKQMENIIKEINSDKYTKIDDSISFNTKKYYSIDLLKQLDEANKNEIINKNYNLDGLILIPNIAIPKKNIDSIWEANLKWKPKILNTIDFKIKIINDEYHLYSYIIDKKYDTIKKKYITYKKDVIFQSIQPYIQNIHIIPKSEEQEKTLITQEIILDNQIVECILDVEDDYSNINWKFLRIRYDKNIPNSFDVANKTFFNIFNTFSLVEINEISNISKTYKSYINSYYDAIDSTTNNRYNDPAIEYRKYNNIIKNEIIKENLPIQESDLNILDIGCGRGGDINKFMEIIINNKKIDLNLYLGIDKDNNNITGNSNARERFINLITKNNKYNYFKDKFHFITGDINKLNDNEVQDSNLILKSVIENQYDENFIENIKKIDSLFDVKIIDQIIRSDTKFHFINCQFMIHYVDSLSLFFNSMYKLLDDNGIIVITYIDSEKLKILMEDTKTTEEQLLEIKDQLKKIVNPDEITENDIYIDDFQTLVMNNKKLYVKLNSTKNFNEENLINNEIISNTINTVDNKLQLNTLPKTFDSKKNNSNPMSEINSVITLSKKKITQGGKSEIEFLNFILNL